MKIMKKSLFAIIAGAIFLTSCSSDFLETAPTSSVSEADIFKNVESALMAVDGLHRQLHDCSSDWYSQGSYPTFCIHLAALSDDWIFTYNNVMFMDTQQYIHHRDLTHKYHDPNYYWKAFYKLANNANKILFYIDDLEGDESLRTFIKGQALAYRAFAHLQLVQAWAERYDWTKSSNDQLGVPIRIEASYENLPRASVEEVYTQINADLDAAIKLLESTDYVKYNKSHIDQWVAKGFKARVLLNQGKWAEAAKYAQDIVDNSGAALQTSTYTDTDKENRFGEASNKEWLWACISSRDDQSQFGSKLRSWHDLVSNNAGSYNSNSPRAINCLLYNTIPDTDVRKAMWLPDPYTAPVVYINASGKKAPYMAQKFLVDDCVTKYEERDVPYMRLPEMMLIAAECYARTNETSKAEALLLKLGQFRDPSYTIANASVAKGEDATLLNKIMWQKRVELWGEAGIRWIDLKRLNLPCDRGPAPREGYNQGGWKNTAKSAPTNLDPEASNYNMYGAGLTEEARVIPAGDKRWQWLLPSQEVDVSGCEQNPL